MCTSQSLNTVTLDVSLDTYLPDRQEVLKPFIPDDSEIIARNKYHSTIIREYFYLLLLVDLISTSVLKEGQCCF